ncbi:MAG TPA: DnaJ C-terminal domain-containing protein [Acetobacteraceae bacterium]|jgi:DnaJ-class molecular chaperone|nr:DnaJ C-terminal domain-containing protein [Acetobacteraceae bacterium]
MRDPYEVLGVEKTASEAAIRAAYRKLAKRHHPDLNPGKAEAAERFKEINAANDILSDATKRARYDRGEIDAAGNEKPPEHPFYRDFGDAPGHEKYQGNIDPEDLESIFAHAFAGATAGGRPHGATGGRRFSARGPDAHYTLTVSFLDAANGTTRRITLPEGRTLDVRIPAGVRDGRILRLKGQGMPGLGGGPPGDALVEIAVAPHPLFRREGDDIIVELPVTIQEAVLGATLEVPTIKGKVRLTVPPNSGTGTRLRLRGRGIHQGHQFVQLHVVLPPEDEPGLAEFLKTWQPVHPFNPRAGLEDA